MAKKPKTVIDINVFDPDSISAAIVKLNAYKEQLIENLDLLREKVADYIRQRAQEVFDVSVPDDFTETTVDNGFSAGVSQVTVTTEHDGVDITLVVASGDHAIFIEFGAGVHHNGASGYSPHPWGEEHGFLIGEAGQGKGSYDKWAITKGVWSYGTKATMPMYHAVQSLKNAFPSLVMEVFR